MASFDGQNIFELLKHDLWTYKAIYEHLMEKAETYKNDNDFYRLGAILNKRRVVVNELGSELKVTTLISELITDSNYRDSLIKMGRLCPNFSLMNSFLDQATFKRMIPHMTNEVIESLNECNVQNTTLDLVTMLDWPSDLHTITLMSDKITITADQLAVHAKNMSGENTSSRPVKCTAIDLRWVFEHQHNFVTLAAMLTKLPNGFYSSKFMIFLLNRFWKPAKKEIILK